MAPRRMMATATILDVLRRPGVAIGMTGCVIVHTGQYAMFTYIRPALENITQLDVDHLSLILLGFGVANFIGTLLTGWLMERSLRFTLILMPALVGLAALGMILLPLNENGLILFVALWVMAFGGVPVAWSNWVARSVPDQAETAGGMVVAAVQSSIAAGAALGGLLFSISGVIGVFITAGCVMFLATLVIGLKVKIR